MFQVFNLTEVYAAQSVAHAPSIYSGPPAKRRPRPSSPPSPGRANGSLDPPV
jgi:hypothetical protein